MVNVYYVILKGNNLALAETEFNTLWRLYSKEENGLELVSNVVYKLVTKIKLDKSCDFFSRLKSRLTYTNYIGEFLEEFSDIDDYNENILKVGFEEYDGVPFRFKVKKSRIKEKLAYDERVLAGPIWKSFSNPIVSIDDYKVEFNPMFIEGSESILFCKKFYENEKDYKRRMPTLRPVKMPYTLKSDMARACVNLLGIDDGVILDPFCGTGGILLEAYDMGFSVIGNDINVYDLYNMRENFDYFYPDAYESGNVMTTLCDSQTQFLDENSIDGIVSDIPYGKCSRKLGDDLYNRYLEASQKYLKKDARMIIVYANFSDFSVLADKYFEIEHKIEEFINKSMTRYILVLKNSRKE